MSRKKIVIANDNQTPTGNDHPNITVKNLPTIVRSNRQKINQMHKEFLVDLRNERSIKILEGKENWALGFESHLLEIKSLLDDDNAAFKDKNRQTLLALTEQHLKTVAELGDRMSTRRKDLQQQKKNNEFDVTKLVTFALVFPAGAYNAFKEKSTLAAEISATLLFVGGVGYHCREHFRKAGKALAKDLRPKDIRASFYFQTGYIKHCVKEGWLAVRKQFAGPTRKDGTHHKPDKKNAL